MRFGLLSLLIVMLLTGQVNEEQPTSNSASAVAHANDEEASKLQSELDKVKPTPDATKQLDQHDKEDADRVETDILFKLAQHHSEGLMEVRVESYFEFKFRALHIILSG